MGDVVQQEINLRHHNNWKRITKIWWQRVILKLFAQNLMKGKLLFNVWWMSMKRALPPFKQGIKNCSKMILTSLRQVRNWWCACPLASLRGWRIKNGLILTSKWFARLMKHLKKAQSSNIKQIRFIRHIGRLDIYDDSREYDIDDDCHIWDLSRERYHSLCKFLSDKWHYRRWETATGSEEEQKRCYKVPTRLWAELLDLL